jgi:hypothetical protein
MSTNSDNDRKKGKEEDNRVLSQVGEDPGTVIGSQADDDNINSDTTLSKRELEHENYEAVSGQNDLPKKSKQ